RRPDLAHEHGAREHAWRMDHFTGVIQPMPAPPGSISMAMRPTLGTSKIGIISLAPALTALATRLSTSSTARKEIQLSGTLSNSGAMSENMPATALPPIVATQ